MTYEPEIKFCDKVEVTKGFFEGLMGQAMDKCKTTGRIMVKFIKPDGNSMYANFDRDELKIILRAGE